MKENDAKMIWFEIKYVYPKTYVALSKYEMNVKLFAFSIIYY